MVFSWLRRRRPGQRTHRAGRRPPWRCGAAPRLEILEERMLLAASVLYVDANNTTGTSDGTVTHPFPTIQAAVTAATAGTMIDVAQGTYAENVVLPDMDVQLLGGFAGGTAAGYANGQAGDFAAPDPSTNVTRITGASDAPVLFLQNFSAITVVIDGFDITGGHTGIYVVAGDVQFADVTISHNVIENNGPALLQPPGGTYSNVGGGIYAVKATITVANNVIRNNNANRGAGMFIASRSDFTITNNLIENNTGYDDHGGGVDLAPMPISAPGNGVFSGNIIRGNVAGKAFNYGWGGGILVAGDLHPAAYKPVILSNNVWTGNYAPSVGGAIFVDNGATVRLDHELIYNNSTSTVGGGAIYVDGDGGGVGSYLTVVNCTIADNSSAAATGNGLYVDEFSRATVSNSIFWGNTDDLFQSSTSRIAVSYTDSQKAWPGTGNRSVDPLFANPAGGDYHLQSNVGRWDPTAQGGAGGWVQDAVQSPAIDAGDPASAYANEPVPNGYRLDLGVYGNTAEASLSTATTLAYHVVLQTPSQVTPGMKFTVRATAYGSDGQPNPLFTGSIALSLQGAPAGGQLSGVLRVPAVAGVATFRNLSVNFAGSYTLLAASTSDLVAALSVPIVVAAPAPTTATHLAVTPSGNTATTGQSVTFRVTPLDGKNLPVAVPDVLQFRSSDPHAILPTETPFTPDAGGGMTFRVTFGTTGPQTITVTDASRRTLTGTATVSVGAVLDHFELTGFPATDVTGVGHKVTVTAVDVFGNTVTSYPTTAVTVTSSDPAFTPGTVTLVKGVGSATLTLTTLGSQSLTASASAISGSQSNINVVSPATHLGVAANLAPATVTAGTSFTVTVKGLLASGATDPSFTDALQVTANDPTAAITPGPLANGIQTFTVTLYTAGSRTITVTDLTRPAVKGPKLVLAVAPAAASQLAVSGFPATVLAGSLHRVTVTALDPYGNRSTRGFGDSVTLTGVSPPYTFKPSDAGAHVFLTALSSPGTGSLTAADITPGTTVTSGSMSSIAVVDSSLTASMGIPAFDLPGQPNGVPGQALPFTLTASQNGIPANAPFTYRIDWTGKGSALTTVAGPSGLTANHVYPAAGSYTIRSTVLDAAGDVVQHATQTITIASAALEMNPSDSTTTVLVIGAAAAGGTIVLAPSAGSVPVAVTINGAAQTVPSPPSPVGLIVAFGQGGNDVLRESGSVGIPAILVGGGGANRLSVVGSSANNLLIGGSAGTLQAGNAADVLVAGSTPYDANLAALSALMAEWASADTYSDRVRDLFGNGPGGLNGSYYLNPQTVVRDTALSRLVGGTSGASWFWFSDSLPRGDSIAGYRDGDVATVE